MLRASLQAMQNGFRFVKTLRNGIIAIFGHSIGPCHSDNFCKALQKESFDPLFCIFGEHQNALANLIQRDH